VNFAAHVSDFHLLAVLRQPQRARTQAICMHPDHELDRATWDELAAVHGQDAYYDSEALIAGASSLIEEEETALDEAVGGDVAGRRVLHVQCHLGFDAITFARRGAHVTGADFSTAALEKAKALAERCGVTVEWVCADSTDLPDSLNGRFDLAWATIGVLCWIADLGAWMHSVARTLAPAGRLVLIDGHPLGSVLKSVPLRIARPFGGGVRRISEVGCDYATETRTGPQVQFIYSLGEIVTAAADAGLRVTHLREHTDLSSSIGDDRLELGSDGRYRRRIDGHAVPVLFTMLARR
jgi:SAM-dependent methyltransferase